jgi:hypothetical protein
MSRLLVLAIAAVTAATAGASTPPYRVRTLATAPSIWWFGQDHGWLAWATERRYRFVLTVRKGRRHGRIDLGLERGNENTVIAQAGPRILWTDFASGNIFYQYLYVGWATGGRGGFFREYDSDAGDGEGDHECEREDRERVVDPEGEGQVHHRRRRMHRRCLPALAIAPEMVRGSEREQPRKRPERLKAPQRHEQVERGRVEETERGQHAVTRGRSQE